MTLIQKKVVEDAAQNNRSDYQEFFKFIGLDTSDTVNLNEDFQELTVYDDCQTIQTSNTFEINY